MKQIILPVAIALLALSSLTACAPEEAEVCKHVVETMSTDNDRPTWMDHKDNCVEHMKNTKKRYGVNSYRREVQCFLESNTSFKIRTCIDTEARRR